MTYRAMSGLGADAPARPAWCPGTSLPSGTRDPCEVSYAFDLPLVGKTTFGLPIPAMTNDALLTAERQLPEILDRTLPVVYQKTKPYIDGIFADLEYELPALADKILKEQVLPQLERQKEEIVAQTEVLSTRLLLGLTVLTGVGLAGLWYIRKH